MKHSMTVVPSGGRLRQRLDRRRSSASRRRTLSAGWRPRAWARKGGKRAGPSSSAAYPRAWWESELGYGAGKLMTNSLCRCRERQLPLSHCAERFSIR